MIWQEESNSSSRATGPGGKILMKTGKDIQKEYLLFIEKARA
jgi:hypothetical protein